MNYSGWGWFGLVLLHINHCSYYLSLIGIIWRWGFLIWELIFIYCGLFILILVVCFCFFFVLFLLSLRFGQISPLAFFRWFLPRPRIGMLSLVTVSPIITAFHSCCLWHHVFWPSKPLAGLGRIWNRYLLTMLTWNCRDSTPLSAAPRAITFTFRQIPLEKVQTPLSS